MTDSAGVPAAWYPDPTGRHEHRYWDAERWTEQVSDRGVAGVDPPSAAAPASPPLVAPGAPSGGRTRQFLLLALAGVGTLIAVGVGVFVLATQFGGGGGDSSLAFRPVLATIPAGSGAPVPDADASDAVAAIQACDGDSLKSLYPAIVPTTPARDQPAEECIVLEDPMSARGERMLLAPVRLTEAVVRDAEVVSRSGGDTAVNVFFTDPGLDEFNLLVAELYGKEPPENRLAFVVDGKVVVTPSIESAYLSGGNLQISGDFTRKEAERIASEIRDATD